MPARSSRQKRRAKRNLRHAASPLHGLAAAIVALGLVAVAADRHVAPQAAGIAAPVEKQPVAVRADLQLLRDFARQAATAPRPQAPPRTPAARTGRRTAFRACRCALTAVEPGSASAQERRQMRRLDARRPTTAERNSRSAVSRTASTRGRDRSGIDDRQRPAAEFDRAEDRGRRAKRAISAGSSKRSKRPRRIAAMDDRVGRVERQRRRRKSDACVQETAMRHI